MDFVMPWKKHIVHLSQDDNEQWHILLNALLKNSTVLGTQMLYYLHNL